MEKVNNDDTANTAPMSNADGDVTETDLARPTANGEGRSENAADDELPDIAMTECSGPSVNTEVNGDDDPSTPLSLSQASDENSLPSRKTNQADASPLAVGGAASVNGQHSDNLTLPTDAEDQRKSPRKVNKKQVKEMVGKGPDSGKVSKPEPTKKKGGDGLKERKSPGKRASSEASDRGGKAKKTDKPPAAERNKDSARKTNQAPKSKTDKAPAAERNKGSPRKTNKAPKSKTDKVPAAEQNKDSPRDKIKEPKAKTDQTPAAEQEEDSPSGKSKDRETTVERDEEETTASEPNTFQTIDRLEERTTAEERAMYNSPNLMRFELFVQRTCIEEERRAHDRYSQMLNDTRQRLMSCVPDGAGDSGRLGSRIMRFFFRHQEQGQGDTAA